MIYFLYMAHATAAAQTPIQTTAVSVNTSTLDAVFHASPVVQLTLLILIGLSVFCWAVGITKYKQFRDIALANDKFLNRFWNAKSLESLFEDVDQFKNSSVAHVFKSGYLELQKLLNVSKTSKSTNMQIGAVDNLERTLQKAMDIEISMMESRLTLLATTGSTGPFIGLFGTVWGIMGSFHKIGASGSASLAVVAPGISEALIATAIGLAAAIPAVVMYNNFVSRIRKEEVALTTFGSDLLNIIKRHFFKES